jgi:hypothetical protein
MALGSRSPEKSQPKSGSSSSSEPAGPEVETAVSRSQVDHIGYPGRSGYALAKALTEARSLGGSKLNLKGTGWKTDGTSWSMDGGEVASGTECTVILGTRLTPSKSSARVLASSVRLGLARCGEATPVVVSGEDNTRHVPRRGAGIVDSLWSDSRRSAASGLATVAPSPPPPARRVAGQTRVFLFCHEGKSSSSSPPSGEPTAVVVAVLRGEEYHVIAAVAGHELETPEAEHRPQLKRLLKATHLELNGKVFVNTQQAPTWRANCRHFGPARTINRLVNLSLRVPAQMG